MKGFLGVTLTAAIVLVGIFAGAAIYRWEAVTWLAALILTSVLGYWYTRQGRS